MGIYIPRRYITVCLCCLGMVLSHCMRANLAVTVVMLIDVNAHKKVGSFDAVVNLPAFKWNMKEVGFLHSVFYIGNLVTIIPAGYYSSQYPSHRIFGGCYLFSSVLNLLLPVGITHFGYYFTCVIRFLQGLSEGFLVPSSYDILRHWTTPADRGKTGAIVFTGMYAGAIIGFPIAGSIAHFIGWQYIFYGNGALGILWFLFWLIFIYERPAYHPSISNEEVKQIHDSQGYTLTDSGGDSVPWKSILLSLPVWALCLSHFGRSWIFYLMLTNEPTYLNIFHYTIQENGFLSSLPHIGMVMIAVIGGPVADHMLHDPMLSTTNVRKIMNTLGFGMESMCFFMLGATTNGTMAIVILTLGIGFSGLTVSGWQINHLDIAPRYASVLGGLSTGVGTFAAILGPILAGWLTVDQTVHGWQIVFIISAVILLFILLFFAVFGDGQIQEWALPSSSSTARLLGDKNLPKPYLTINPKPDGKVAETSPKEEETDTLKDMIEKTISVTDRQKQSLEMTTKLADKNLGSGKENSDSSTDTESEEEINVSDKTAG